MISARFPGIESTSRFEKVIDAPDVDAILLATPVRTHYEMAKLALQAGKSVLVEKPMATSTAEAENLLSLAKAQGLLVSAGHTFLHSPGVQHVKSLIATGVLGSPLYVQSSRINLGLHQSDVSVIWDLAPHDLSILQYWLDENAVEVSAKGRSSFGVGPADVAFLDVEYESGCIANLHLSWLAPTKVRRTTVVGSRRMIIYEDTDQDEPIKVYDKGVDLPEPEDFGQFKAAYRSGDIVSPRIETWEPLRAQIDEFLRRVKSGELPDEREVAVVEVVRIAEAAELSLSLGGVPVKL